MVEYPPTWQEIGTSQGDKITKIKEIIDALDALTAGDWQESVLDRLATPPAHVDGERYLIIATASGDWTGREDDIAESDGVAWSYVTPTEGSKVWVEDENAIYMFIASWAIWENQAVATTSDVTFNSIDITVAQGDILYADVVDSLARLAKGTEGQILMQGATVPSWGARAGTGKAETIWFEDFESYAVDDAIHSVTEKWSTYDTTNDYFKATATAKNGSRGAEWKWGTGGESGRHHTLLPFNTVLWGSYKFSWYWRITAGGSNGLYCRPGGWLYDDSQSVGNRFYSIEKYYPQIRWLGASSGFQTLDSTGTFVTVKSSLSQSVWYYIEAWVRQGKSSTTPPQFHLRIDGTHYPTSTTWEDLDNADNADRVAFYGMFLDGSWDGHIAQYDDFKVETFDPLATTFV